MVLWAHTRVQAERLRPPTRPRPFGLRLRRGPDRRRRSRSACICRTSRRSTSSRTRSPAEFYIWLRWSGDIDPTVSCQITNAVNLSDLARSPCTPTPPATQCRDHAQWREAPAVPRLRPLRPPIPARAVSVRRSRHRAVDRGREEPEHAAGPPGRHPGQHDAARSRSRAGRSARCTPRVGETQFATDFGDLRDTARERRTRASTSGAHRPARRRHRVEDRHPDRADPPHHVRRVLLPAARHRCAALPHHHGADLGRRAADHCGDRAAADRLAAPPRQDLHPQLRHHPRGHVLLHRRESRGAR